MPEMWNRIRSWIRPGSRRSPLLVRTGSTRKRDAYKAATAGVTGITAFGALAVTGAVAGAAAHQQAQDQAEPVVQPPVPPTTQVVEKRRKHRTVVQTRVVHQASGGTVTRTGSGGTVRSGSSGSSGSSGGSGGSGGSSGGGQGSTPSTPQAPPPAPAPSSGS